MVSFSPKIGGEISEGALERLMSYHWPGNVRELENVIERTVLLAKGPRVEADDIRIDTTPSRARGVFGEPLIPEGMTLDEFEQSISAKR